MICPHCKSERSEVKRVVKYETVNFRWRKCLDCGGMFQTEEVETNGRREMEKHQPN